MSKEELSQRSESKDKTGSTIPQAAVVAEEKETWRGCVVLCGCTLLSSSSVVTSLHPPYLPSAAFVDVFSPAWKQTYYASKYSSYSESIVALVGGILAFVGREVRGTGGREEGLLGKEWEVYVGSRRQHGSRARKGHQIPVRDAGVGKASTGYACMRV
ncbi:hypothetical protein QFC21_006908 [Naganishia friedmannii]|uniref:Uncharacterized protein n=1 Tax=Naganishia friedmannii TaxID=89922 RepID=A0ACC2V070_9TREE|nr:hypothetical protein QFC21_006908 [Naganishia friedmannii]